MPAMARFEQLFCRSAPWRAFSSSVVVPWALGGFRPEGRVLEIGGGSGAMAAALLRRFPSATLTVTDVDLGMVRVAMQRLTGFGDRARVHQADASHLPFSEGSFDVVVSFIMLHHVGPWEDALGEAVRVLRPGGHLIGYDLLRTRPAALIHRIEGEEHRMVSVPELGSVLSALAVEDIRVKPGLGGVVARFAARRLPA